jgi:glutamine amidotransferase
MVNNKIVIVDYGMGNLRSVQKAFEKVGFAAVISEDPVLIQNADKLVLPGVGAIRDAVGRIRDIGLEKPILDHLHSDKPFFGICLGLQMLFENCYEDGKHRGLGFYKGDVVKFSPVEGLKIPHMGWNHLELQKDLKVFKSYPKGAGVYFVHSYFAVPENKNVVAAYANYPLPFAAVGDDRRIATQFHPEKSQAVGLQMLKHFAELS